MPTTDRDADDAVEALLESFRPKARRILSRYRIPPADAEDLLQETLLVFLYKQPTIRAPEPWLIGTLRNRCLVYWRQRRRKVYQAVDTALLESVPESGGTKQEKRDIGSDLSGAIGELPQRCQSLLALRYQLGCTPHEAAERLGYRRSGIYKVMERCLAALTTRLVASGVVRERKPA